MNAVDLLSECQSRGIVLRSHGGDELEIDAPKNQLTPELLQNLRRQKNGLLQLLTVATATQVPKTQGKRELCHRRQYETYEVGGLSIDLQPPAVTVTDPAPWKLPPWPPVVPAEIIADPIPTCCDCGTGRVNPGQPGRIDGLCFSCWMHKQRK